MRPWRWRTTLTLRAAVALAIQIGVVVVASLLNLAYGLLLGALLYVFLAIVLAFVLPRTVETSLVGTLWLVVPTVGVGLPVLFLLGLPFTTHPLREEVLRDAYEAEARWDDRHLQQTVHRLAALVDCPQPTVYLHRGDEPLCCSFRREGESVLVAAAHLPDLLSEAELEAVLAHEIAHVANGDHRLLRAVTAPLSLVHTDDDVELRHWFNPFVGPLEAASRATDFAGKLAVGLFSRGREFAADREAARTTGDPAALASALRTLSESADRSPTPDLREHAHAVDAASVYPVVRPAANDGASPLSTHPSVEERIRRLRRLAERS